VETRFRGRLTEHAYEYTKGMLLDGLCPPGSRIRVEDVVSALKTSRQPVMEAFKRLASEGFLEIIPQVGCRVVTPDRREISDFFRLFAAAEGLTAEFAAQRSKPDERVSLRSVHAQIESIQGAGLDVPTLAHRYRSLNRRFHETVHELAHSQAVGSAAASFWDRSDFYIATATSGSAVFARRIGEAHAEHAAILSAIEEGDEAEARSAMESHVLAFGRSSHGILTPSPVT
jgi:DNA-binding GntR family transcriptional regulator